MHPKPNITLIQLNQGSNITLWVLTRNEAVDLGPDDLQSTCFLGEIWNSTFIKNILCRNQDLL